MNTSASPKNDDTDLAMAVGSLALLASLSIFALFYLGGYSMGREFSDRPPQFNRTLASESAVR